MKEDTALMLKKAYDAGDKKSIKEAKKILESSKLVGKLLMDPKQRLQTFVGLRAIEWRLIELCEIPYMYTSEKVQRWLEILVNRTSIPEGFSLTGDKNGLLACHNAMITNILLRMEFDDTDNVEAGINWIVEYQNVERGIESNSDGDDLFTK